MTRTKSWLTGGMAVVFLIAVAKIAWQERLGFTLPTTEPAHARAALPHHFAWQFGWDETALWENKPVLVCRRPRLSVSELWPKVKKWN